MRGPKGTCLECHAVVGAQQTAVYQVVGYVHERSAGGANHVIDERRVDGRIWHQACFDVWQRRRKGQGRQEALTL